MKRSEMNKFQIVAYEQVIHASNLIIGEYKNKVAAGNMEISEIPNHEDLAKEIYEAVLNSSHGPGTKICMRPIKNIEFAGMIFIQERIGRKLKRDGY